MSWFIVVVRRRNGIVVLLGRGLLLRRSLLGLLGLLLVVSTTLLAAVAPAAISATALPTTVREALSQVCTRHAGAPREGGPPPSCHWKCSARFHKLPQIRICVPNLTGRRGSSAY